MRLTTLLLVLGSALAHAIWNALLKRCRDPEGAMASMMIVGGVGGALAAVVLAPGPPPAASAAFSVASGVLEAGYFVALARALARAPLGSVYTVARGGALAIVWPLSILFLHEEVSAGRLAGVGLVVLGLAAVGAAERRPTSTDSGTDVRGIAYAAVAAVFIGGFNLTYKLALTAGGSPPAVNGVSLVTGSTLNALLFRTRRRAAVVSLQQEPIKVVVGGLLATGGFLVFLSAMQDAGAGAVLTLRNTSILFAQALALAMGERLRPLGLAGAALVTLGAVLLAR
jgi:drug/metabolite transporter (DMT)-like permease